jgi:glucan phosphoethanolaminetransferase (alkaline phosphatase superfamily)
VKPFLFKWLTAVFAVTLLSSIVSMMATFVGSQGVDLQDLLELQVVLTLIAVAVAISCFGLLIRRYGHRGAFERFWAYLPGWLLFALLAANSLVVIAELSFL